ncbi:MAG: hypothetical protein HQK88_08455 [Nitrospirae bacterium]|nr:hypothetical protein [Nitrospirota bacterium]MBF0536096.1 hypothetical protein [Nitrospirota bacterium]MBF0616832.1 hypothetical protein [Nitrospirota bacterium]
MDNLVKELSADLDKADIQPCKIYTAQNQLLLFADEHKNELSHEDKKAIESFKKVFSFEVRQQHNPSKKDKSRFYTNIGVDIELQENELIFINDVSTLLNHYILAPFLDDILIESKDKLKNYKDIDVITLAQRTIDRYLIQVEELKAKPEADRPEFWQLAIMDSLDRALELSLKFNQKDRIDEALVILNELGKSFHSVKDWRWLLPVVQSYVRAVDNKEYSSLVSDKERIKSWAEECADGFAKDDGLFHLIYSANNLSAKIGKSLGEEEPEKRAKNKSVEQISMAAHQRAENGDFISASTILDMAIILAEAGDDHETMKRLSNKKTRYFQQAEQAGQFSKHEFELKLGEKETEEFLTPFRQAESLEKAIGILIGFPGIVPDYDSLEKMFTSNPPLSSLIAQNVIIDGMGTQIAGEGLKRTGIDLQKNIFLSNHVQIMAHLFLELAFLYLEKEKNLNDTEFNKYLGSWKFIHQVNKSIVEHGVKKHFEKDYISALHILVPQFEGTLRRAFHTAGYNAVIPEYTKDEGISIK